MDTNYRINCAIFFGQVHRSSTALDGGTDCNDPTNPGLIRATQDVIKVTGKIGVIEMRMSINQFWPNHCVFRVHVRKIDHWSRPINATSPFDDRRCPGQTSSEYHHQHVVASL